MYSRKIIFASACLGMLFFGISMITLGSVVPDLAGKLGLDEISAGTLFSILPVGILAGSLLFGPLADRFGYRLLLAVSCWLLAAGFEGIAFTGDKSVIKFFVLLVGFSGGAINGATNAVVSDISENKKGADLSLLGVFFGVGALGMPLVLGLLRNTFPFESILSAVGIMTFIAGIVFLVIRFPLPKQAQGFPIAKSLSLLKDRLLICIAVFLFFQSSAEGIINNWTTTYLIGHLSVKQDQALFALSSFVSGMAIMRFISGAVIRNIREGNLLYICFILSLTGLIILRYAPGVYPAAAGLFVMGAGLSAGFPVMLGFAGNLHKDLSGTAFSLVLSFALIGNMLVNYSVGVIAKHSGIKHLLTISAAELIVLMIMAIVIMKRIRNQKIT